MKILITGASGFVGGAIARKLRTQHQLLGLARSAASAEKVAEAGLQPLSGELGKIEASTLTGVEVIIHCAAHVAQWGRREEFWRTNVVGTEQLLQAASAAGVRRFIHMGTEAALFDGAPLVQIDEGQAYPASTPYLYSETKAEAEKRVLAANGEAMQTLSLRPRLVWGPGDQTVLPELLEMVRSGQYWWVDQGRNRTSTCHIANLVHATTLALDSGRGGQPYFIVDPGQTTYREFLTALMATRGVTPPGRSLPGTVIRGMAGAMDLLWRTLRLRGQPPLTPFAAAMLSRECTIESDKAARELGFRAVMTRDQGLAELAAVAV